MAPSPKSPALLKRQFAELFGPGRYARIVWQVESRDGRKPNFDTGGQSTLMALDTRDGIVRELVPAQAGTHWSAASFTWDGSLVVYTDNESKRVWVVNWDGARRVVLLDDHEGDGRCWQSPDGRQWALVTQWSPDPTAYVKLHRVSVDNPRESVEILTTAWPRPQWAGSTCWASMSVDGSHVAAGFPNYDDLGLLDVASGAVRRFPVNGCWPTIARDNTYDVLYTNAGPDAHRAVRIVDKDGNEVLKQSLAGSVLAEGEFHESLRWTPDRDFVTVSVYKQGFISAGLPAPRIVRLSDLKWVAINDTPASAEGNADVFFYDN